MPRHPSRAKTPAQAVRTGRAAGQHVQVAAPPALVNQPPGLPAKSVCTPPAPRRWVWSGLRGPRPFGLTTPATACSPGLQRACAGNKVSSFLTSPVSFNKQVCLAHPALPAHPAGITGLLVCCPLEAGPGVAVTQAEAGSGVTPAPAWLGVLSSYPRCGLCGSGPHVAECQRDTGVRDLSEARQAQSFTPQAQNQKHSGKGASPCPPPGGGNIPRSCAPFAC